MDERYRLLNEDEITSEHKKLAHQEAERNRKAEKPEREEASSNLKRFNWIWLKLKKIIKETDEIREVLGKCVPGGTREFLGKKTKVIRDNAREGDRYMQAYNAGSQAGGETGVYSLAQIRQAIKNTHGKPKPASQFKDSRDHQVQQNGDLKQSPATAAPAGKVRLKPISDVFKEGSRRIVLTHEKNTRELYILDLATRKIIAHPRGIKELFTDEVGNRVIALVTCIQKECYFIDTFNKEIISGPYDNVKEVTMVHQYKNRLLAQIRGLDSEQYFVDIYKGERFTF